MCEFSLFLCCLTCNESGKAAIAMPLNFNRYRVANNKDDYYNTGR